MVEKLPPDWAWARLRELKSEQSKLGVANAVEAAFARYIAEREEPPVDPLYEALKAVVELGRYDTREQTELLRRELALRGLFIGENVEVRS